MASEVSDYKRMQMGSEVSDYIAQRAASMGIDPAVALKVAGHEGLPGFNPNAPDLGGDHHSSFGPFQLHIGGISPLEPNPGLGDAFKKATGLDARDPSTWKQQVDFALSQAKQGGWGPWMGAKAEGITGFAGMAGMGTGSHPHPIPGTTLTSVPPAAVAVAPTPPPPTLGENFQKGDYGAVIQQLAAKQKDAQGNEKPSALDNIAGIFKPKEQQQLSQPSQPLLPQDPTPAIAPRASQLLSQTFANSAKPLSWSTTPFGSGTAGPIAPGTTLSGVPPNVYG